METCRSLGPLKTIRLSVLLFISLFFMLWGVNIVWRRDTRDHRERSDHYVLYARDLKDIIFASEGNRHFRNDTHDFMKPDFEDSLVSQYDCIHPDISTYDKLLLLNDSDKQVPKESEIKIFSRAKRVVGGMELNYGEWPFLVSMRLRLNGSFQHLCGGVLIHPHYVLSAAHCFEKFWKAELTDDPDFWMVRVGEHNMAEDTDSKEDYEVRSIIRYKGRKFGEFQNDIAFIKLKTPVTLGPYVRPICLPDPRIDKWNEHSHCLVRSHCLDSIFFIWIFWLLKNCIPLEFKLV